MDEDAYDGHAEPGGPAISRRIQLGGGAAVELRKLSVGPMDNNVYLLIDAASERGLLIDAADDAGRINAELGPRPLAGVVTTHGHRDHWQALAAVAQGHRAPGYLHPADAPMVPVRPDHQLADGMRVAFGQSEVSVLHTPGHTPGSVCVLLEGLDRPHLLTGDTLFPGGPGRVITAVEFEQIMETLELRLFTLPDETWVYPGHGDDTTLGTERPHLPAWRARGW